MIARIRRFVGSVHAPDWVVQNRILVGVGAAAAVLALCFGLSLYAAFSDGDHTTVVRLVKWSEKVVPEFNGIIKKTNDTVKVAVERIDKLEKVPVVDQDKLTDEILAKVPEGVTLATYEIDQKTTGAKILALEEGFNRLAADLSVKPELPVVRATPAPATSTPATQAQPTPSAPSEPVKPKKEEVVDVVQPPYVPPSLTEMEKAGQAVGERFVGVNKRLDEAFGSLDILNKKTEDTQKALEAFGKRQGTADDFIRGLDAKSKEQAKELEKQSKAIEETKALAAKAQETAKAVATVMAAANEPAATPVQTAPAAKAVPVLEGPEFPNSGLWKDYSLEVRMFVAKREFQTACGFVPEKFSGPKVEAELMKFKYQADLFKEIAATCQKVKASKQAAAEDDEAPPVRSAKPAEPAGERSCRDPNKKYDPEVGMCSTRHLLVAQR